jgi:hypothetical protein
MVALTALSVIVAGCGDNPASPTPIGSQAAASATVSPALGASAPATSAPTPGASAGTSAPAASPTPAATLAPALASGFRVHAYAMLPLALGDRPYAEWTDATVAIDYPADRNGVPVAMRKGKAYLHPVTAAQQGLRQLATYVKTKDPVFLDRAQVIADALVAAGVKADGALWIPYRFDFNLHGKAADVMRAPWYSGMAQGQVLSLVSRLYELTGKASDLDAARRIFASFAVVGMRSKPWVSWVEGRYLWIEEYPGKPPDHTLNGFIFALYGIYDFYEVTHSAAAERVFQGGLTTVRHYLPEFRNPGGISHYCLLHRALSPKYHHIHIGQLRQLRIMTGDAYFATMAALFASDHP